ncbi:glycosyltransferase family 4 protein [Lysinibacillus xylanilyticus]|uniref:glycosyltransferase family 4 protein n=1 Tax=Lysinibacillus xylanilyticus TaxID=582475 RepID=UPI002B243785|nr:glycosyltransferase family 4 protein [Lysinibacillus xylanilyticus]MEB2298030.1 glycosyltransferase family 4 protein [Lysinibacillus xylanilyticus]
MKVLFVASVFRHFKAFHIPYLNYFKSIGAEVYAAANKEDGEDREMLESLGINCIEIEFERNPLHLKNIKSLNQLIKLKESIEFDLIHTHTPMASFLLRYVYRNDKRTKIIYTAHGFHFYKGAPLINWIVYYNIEKVASRWTNHLITINNEDFQNANLLGYTQENTSYVHGVGIDSFYKVLDDEKKQNLMKELKIKNDDIIISYIAELNNNKNQMFLLENWNKIKQECKNAKLLLIGTGENLTFYKNYVIKNQLKDIEFTGFRNDVMDILQISHINILLSKREGLGKCLLEGMICRLPCIATNTRGPKDLIKDGVNGFLVDLSDGNKLIDSLVSLIKNETLRQKMGEESYKIAKEYFIENVIEEYKTIYQKYLGETNEKNSGLYN